MKTGYWLAKRKVATSRAKSVTDTKIAKKAILLINGEWGLVNQWEKKVQVLDKNKTKHNSIKGGLVPTKTEWLPNAQCNKLRIDVWWEVCC